MKRRSFLQSLAALPLLSPGAAKAYEAQTFSRDIWAGLKDSDDIVLLNFRTDWSLTCQLKTEMIDALIAENPSYRTIRIIDVNWDFYGPAEWTKKLGVTRRSTLVVLKSRKEVARLENQPYPRKIKDLFDTALRS